MSRCKQCHLEGHHKMSCTDESNPKRKGRMNMSATLKEPIVKGAYYERGGEVYGPAVKENNGYWRLGPYLHHSNGRAGGSHGAPLTRRVYIVPTDPAEVVAKLRQCDLGSDNHYMAGMAVGYHNAADLVAEKLGVK